MSKKLYFLFLTSFLLSIGNIYADSSPFVRNAALNSDGTELAFTFQGDIWTVPVNGGRAYRLTVHEAVDTSPRWSDDDTSIAFNSDRFGNLDIFTVNSKGGFPKRLTYHSTSDSLTDFSGNELLFETSRGFRQVERENEIYKVSVNGGTPQKAFLSLGSEAVKSPDGKLYAFVRGYCRTAREAYKGAANRDIWVYAPDSDTYFQITDFEGQDYNPVWGSDNTLYFISARNKRYNIFSIKIKPNGEKAGNLKQITHYTEDAVNGFSVSGDGHLIAFDLGTDIYTIPASGGNAEKVNITIGADYRFDPVEHKTFSNGLTEFSVSPDDKHTAFVVRGEVFVTENDKEKSLTTNLSHHPFRESSVAWLNNESLIFSSDRKGKYDLYLVKSSDENNTNLFKSLKHEIIQLSDSAEEEYSPVVSPDGKKIIFVRGAGSMIMADIDKSGKVTSETELLSGWATPSEITWSPDSRWIAYTLEDLSFNAEVYILKADGKSKPVNVSMHPREDFSPVWSPDGSKLGFVSARNNRDHDIWYAWLTEKDWQKTKEDWDESSDEPAPEKKKDKPDDKDKDKDKKEKKKDEVKPIKIDTERIHDRLVQLTNYSGNEGSPVISKDGKTFYFTSVVQGKSGSDIFKIKWNGEDLKQITHDSSNPRGLTLDNTGKYIYFSKRGALARLNEKTGKTERLPFKANMDINYVAELNQVFEEAWRTLRDGFYDPNFHGQDYNALKEKYKPMCLKASTEHDFRFMFNQMLGQLNASHMGLYRGGREETQRETTGLLGVNIKPVKKGFEVTHVTMNSPADKVFSKLNTGDIITAINGKTLNSNGNFWAHFRNTENTKIQLDVIDKNGKSRSVNIRPESSLGNELYNEWVESRRKLTDKLSNGRLGYLHIRGMDMVSFERFERELASAGYGKDAIVIDVRFNGGGWTTDYLMAVLNIKQHAYTIPRGAVESLDEHKKFKNYYPFAERLPFFAWNKPSIALCNEFSYSNAEIFSHAYKTLGIGTLVGKPTFGAVISTGGRSLINGMFVRRPFRAWYVKATEENMEWKPAVPDIIIENSPDGKAKGKDEQLEAAVKELLKQL